MELSVIIPVLNDREALNLLLEDLTRQEGIVFEVLICDGGSTDGSDRAVESFLDRLTIRFLSSPRGRGRQLNKGASEASTTHLVFLHADSRLPSPGALKSGLSELTEAWEQAGHRRIAGHLSLQYGPTPPDSPAWRFWQAKARSGRPLTIHGDQSFWIDSGFFQALGGFEEELSVLEDTRLAERIREKGQWGLLSPQIQTSIRRFDEEGLAERQTLNALILAFDAIGWKAFFENAPSVYREQAQAGRLALLPFWELIQTLLDETSWKQRWNLWYGTGGFVRQQLWQWALWCQVRREGPRFASQRPSLFLQWTDRWWDRLSDNPLGNGLATVLVWGWFHLRYRQLHRSLSS